MRVPMRYQISEYDCGPTAVMNALGYLYSTEEIPPEFVKAIYSYTLDEFNEKGAPCRNGTSQESLRYLSGWFNRYAKTTGYPIRSEFFGGSDVHLGDDSPVVRCLNEGGTAVVRCILECPHYVTLTGIDDEYVHVFDPYYWDVDFGRDGIIKVYDKPLEMNRKIRRNIMDCSDGCNYSLCDTEERAAFLLYKEGTGMVPLQ